jgi:hypothetical protein
VLTWGTAVAADGATHQWHASAGRRMHRTSPCLTGLSAFLSHCVHTSRCCFCGLFLGTPTGRSHTFPFRASCCTPLTRLLGGHRRYMSAYPSMSAAKAAWTTSTTARWIQIRSRKMATVGTPVAFFSVGPHPPPSLFVSPPPSLRSVCDVESNRQCTRQSHSWNYAEHRQMPFCTRNRHSLLVHLALLGRLPQRSHASPARLHHAAVSTSTTGRTCWVLLYRC